MEYRRPGILTLAAIVGVAILCTTIDAQRRVTLVREHSAQQYGEIRRGETITLAPLAAGPGVVFRQPFGYGGATRLHFVVTSPPAAGTWRLRVLDRAAVIWSTSPAEEGAASFWSDDLLGTHLTLEVIADGPSAGLSIAVDKVLVAVAHLREQATTPPFDCKVPVATFSPPQGCHAVAVAVGTRVKTWAPGIARLRLVTDSDQMYYCSGFLITDDLLLTNWHCIQSTSELNATRFDFDYDVDGVKPITLRAARVEMPSSKTALDFIVVRLKSAMTNRSLRLVNVAPASQLLVILQHPDGLPKQVSIEDCKVSSPQLPGLDQNQKTDFGHSCDTLGGSSGSPVQDAGSGDVIGLHHLGFDEGSRQLTNQAVRMGLILTAIRTERPDIYKEIQNAHP